MKKIAITGATSFLGSSLVKKLSSENYEIFAIVRRNSSNLYRLKEFKNINIIELNLDEIQNLDQFINNVDVFLHLAWDGSGSDGRKNLEVQSKNYDYAMNALSVAKKIGCKLFVFPGSQSEYGKCFEETYEEKECFPVSPHGINKLKFGVEAQRILKNDAMKFLHLRIYSVYGKNDRPGTLVESCVNAFMNGETILLGKCEQLWNYLYIDDFAYIISKLIHRHFTYGDLEDIYNIAGPDTKPLKEFVNIIYDKLGNNGEYKLGMREENAEGSPPLIPNLDRLNKIIDFTKLHSFDEGISKMIELKK